MSLPRPVLPGSTSLLTRRCAQRQFLLRPSREVNQILLYCLAVAVQRFDIHLHAFCFLSNHYHLVATDPHARLPEFMHWLNEYIAKCINALLGRKESVWASGSYSSVQLGSSEDLLGSSVYTMANPVSSSLVDRSERWPGLVSRPWDIGRTVFTARMPHVFFRSNGRLPKRISLRLTPPPGRDDQKSLSRWIVSLAEALEAREERLRLEAMRAGRGFLGVRRILRQSPFGRPKTEKLRIGRIPRFSVPGRLQRLEMRLRWREFVAAYRDAWRRFRRGDRTVVFPHGTYGMRVWYGVICAAGP